MAATSVKVELQQLVAQENDERLLRVIKSLLMDAGREELIKSTN